MSPLTTSLLISADLKRVTAGRELPNTFGGLSVLRSQYWAWICLTEEGSLLVMLPLNYLSDAGEIVCSFLLSQIQTLLLLLLLLQI